VLGVPVRQDGTNVVKAPFFRRLTLRSATGTAQRAIPTLMVVELLKARVKRRSNKSLCQRHFNF